VLKSSIETARFYLRHLTVTDVSEEYLSWIRDQNSNRFIKTADPNCDLSSLRSYVAQREHKSDVVFFGIFVRATNQHIGNIKFEPIDSLGGSATMGILIGNRGWRGKSVAAEVLEGCAQWLFEEYGVTKIMLGVDPKNNAGIRAYLKAGFRVDHGRGVAEGGSCSPWMVRHHSSAYRVAVGTAQFGLPYGIANKTGQVGLDEAAKILDCGWASGVGTIDTAIGYGASEERLGEIMVDPWRVVTKLPAIPESIEDISGWVKESVFGALKRLRISKLYGLLLHRPQQLLGAGGVTLFRSLADLREQGKVEKIGVSVYAPEELELLWPHFQFDMVQAPFNVIDRRLATSGWLSKLHLAGTEVHVRSMFLQGLLLMDAASRPSRFSRWNTLWKRWDYWLAEHSLTALQACMSFALSQREIARVVVGVDSLEQFREILACTKDPTVAPPITLMSEDQSLINPSAWNNL
jgi:aryl-alcohol dehydrogenase-like predicted oxidoreductase/RimJ/RimL family protein N-acetyltransferase